jgi:hypothetical protein
MGLIAMSERDLQRIEVLSKVIDDQIASLTSATARPDFDDDDDK